MNRIGNDKLLYELCFVVKMNPIKCAIKNEIKAEKSFGFAYFSLSPSKYEKSIHGWL